MAHSLASGSQSGLQPLAQRALTLWPRLDPSRLRRAKDNPARIARLIERRTGRPKDEILGMLGAKRAEEVAP